MSTATTPIAKPEINKAKNDPPHEIKVTCENLWTLAQAHAIKRLTTQRKEYYLFGDKKWVLVGDFSTRAARIAGVYASFYLEKEDGGKEELKGRFYWMGLAAFASKQVMCGLNFTKLVNTALPVARPVVDIGKNGLGKGNFWLFQDIFCWHWFYSKYPNKFFDCSGERNSNTFDEKIRVGVKSLPWAKESLAVIDNLKVKPEIKSAFLMVKNIETTPSGKVRQSLQYVSLLKIANHEQLNILQPLIYNDRAFQRMLDAQKMSEGLPLVPLRSAAFSTVCDVDDPKLREQMYDGSLYNAQERMIFITSIAKKYHGLMIESKGYMEGEISKIATWKNRE